MPLVWAVKALIGVVPCSSSAGLQLHNGTEFIYVTLSPDSLRLQSRTQEENPWCHLFRRHSGQPGEMSTYKQEVEDLKLWNGDGNIHCDAHKTKEMFVDFTPPPLHLHVQRCCWQPSQDRAKHTSVKRPPYRFYSFWRTKKHHLCWVIKRKNQSRSVPSLLQALPYHVN